MEGVKGEQGGYETALPQGSCHPLKDEKQQQGVYDVNHQIGYMVTAGIQSMDLGIHHVGQPRQRVPVGAAGGCESPQNTLEGKPMHHIRIFFDIGIVIKLNEGMVLHRIVNHQRRHNQDQGDHPWQEPGKAILCLLVHGSLLDFSLCHLTGKCPASPALQGGVKGHIIRKPPYREVPLFRAGSFTSLTERPCLPARNF